MPAGGSTATIILVGSMVALQGPPKYHVSFCFSTSLEISGTWVSVFVALYLLISWSTCLADWTPNSEISVTILFSHWNRKHISKGIQFLGPTHTLVLFAIAWWQSLPKNSIQCLVWYGPLFLLVDEVKLLWNLTSGLYHAQWLYITKNLLGMTQK